MGVVSRQVLPFCGSLCFFCPSMRARSRQPVKRYKKLLADIFPRSQVTFFLTKFDYIFIVGSVYDGKLKDYVNFENANLFGFMVTTISSMVWIRFTVLNF